MKIVILAGGLGIRISEHTKTIPKPMINIAGKPLIYFIMKHYANYGFKDFYIALGYKGHVIKKYFKKKFFDWNVNLIETGQKTMTGGRLKRLKKYIGNEQFMLTYGDGLSNVNIKKLLKFHNQNKKMVTLTAVRPPARFGALKINGNFYQIKKGENTISFNKNELFFLGLKNHLRLIGFKKNKLQNKNWPWGEDLNIKLIENITNFHRYLFFKQYKDQRITKFNFQNITFDLNKKFDECQKTLLSDVDSSIIFLMDCKSNL